MSKSNLSVIICAKNEEKRIARAICSVQACKPFEIMVVDGGSSDNTTHIASDLGVRVIPSTHKGLAADRQLGVIHARGKYIAFIDADHRPAHNALDTLLSEMQDMHFDIIQAGLHIEDNGFLCRAENDALAVFHTKPGSRSQMIGVAPAIFKRTVLEHIPFDSNNALQSDDADLFRRIVRAKKYRFGIGQTVITQEHHGSLDDYIEKFTWYGKQDAQFMLTHPDRAHSMLFHLLFRYPIWRVMKTLVMLKPRAIVYFWLSAYIRSTTCFSCLVQHALITIFGFKPDKDLKNAS